MRKLAVVAQPVQQDSLPLQLLGAARFKGGKQQQPLGEERSPAWLSTNSVMGMWDRKKPR